MAGNKETSIGIKLVADLRNYQQSLGKAQSTSKTFAKNVTANFSSVKSSFTRLLSGDLTAMPDLFKSATKSIAGTTKGLGFLKTALISTGIGAIVIAVGALAAAFTSTEEGAAKLRKITMPLGVLLGNLTDIAADLGEKIIWSFEHPKEAVQGLWEFIKSNFVTRIKALPELVQAAFRVIKSVFNDDSTTEALKEMGLAFTHLTTGLDDKKLKTVTEWGKQNNKEMAKAAALSDKILETDQKERKQKIEKAKLEAQIAELRLKSRKEQYTDQEAAIKYLNQANILQDKLLQTDLDIAQARLEIQKEKNSYSRSNAENLNAEAELEAQVYQIQAARQNAARQIQRELNTLTKSYNAGLEKTLNTQKAINAQIDADTESEFTVTGKSDIDIEKIVGPLGAMQERMSQLREQQSQALSPEIWTEYQSQIEATQKMIDEFTGAVVNTSSAAENVGIMSQSFGQLGSAIGGAAGHFANMASTILGMIPQLITQLAALTATEVAGSQAKTAAAGSAAIAKGTEQSQSVPFPFNLIALAATVGSIIAALATKPPALASGGIAYGDTIARVGEYSNARANPEVIAPLDKLKSMLPSNSGGTTFQVNNTFDGEKIITTIRKLERRERQRT
ncbi:coiled-coil domain-containing protein [Sunxiuqinia indica]|uniref:hypothetical protein n=1 Tax=Sunxiuqinia indica TaxID=2692584 RepID=UPI00135C63E9|nr:hypothetical protein [Sunxiuqinia indica]